MSKLSTSANQIPVFQRMLSETNVHTVEDIVEYYYSTSYSINTHTYGHARNTNSICCIIVVANYNNVTAILNLHMQTTVVQHACAHSYYIVGFFQIIATLSTLIRKLFI